MYSIEKKTKKKASPSDAKYSKKYNYKFFENSKLIQNLLEDNLPTEILKFTNSKILIALLNKVYNSGTT